MDNHLDSKINRKISVAPMMDCTDRHERFFLRLISKNVLLYTEMIVSEAISRGDKKKLLSFNLNEKPLALQVGGSSPTLLAEAAKIGVNLDGVIIIDPISFEKLGNKEAAKMTLQKIINDYPNSKYAKLAKKELEKLKELFYVL